VKASKFLLAILIITFFSLLYVHQQTEIFKLAYQGQKQLVRLQDLLDENAILRYNIEKGSSLAFIGNKAYEDEDFEIPHSYRLVRLNPQEELEVSTAPGPEKNIFVRILGIKRQAEAQTLNP